MWVGWRSGSKRPEREALSVMHLAAVRTHKLQHALKQSIWRHGHTGMDTSYMNCDWCNNKSEDSLLPWCIECKLTQNLQIHVPSSMLIHTCLQSPNTQGDRLTVNAWCVLSAVCSLLSAVCSLLSAVCCLLSAVCCLLSASCSLRLHPLSSMLLSAGM